MVSLEDAQETADGQSQDEIDIEVLLFGSIGGEK